MGLNGLFNVAKFYVTKRDNNARLKKQILPEMKS
ncbi:hypothetical protein BH10BAC2_BH10BAC2_21390 [soil metagenome]